MPLKGWDFQINYGIKTGFNDAFIINGEKRRELIDIDSKSEEIIRPILRGRDIKRYGYDYADLWLINSHNGVKETGVKRINIDDYPAVKQHLDLFYSDLEKRADKGDTPYNLRNCAYMEDFNKQKIVWGNLNLGATYSLAEPGMFINAPCSLITPSEKYLLAILNSKAADYYIRSLGVTRNGGYFEYKPMFIEKLPIPVLSEQNKKTLNDLVDRITLTTSISQKKKYEEEIDSYVFDLYALSKEDIELLNT